MKNALGSNKSEQKKRKTGIATIKVVGDNCKVTFDNENVEFDNGKNFKKFALDDMPKYPKLQEGEKQYFVVLNGDADTVDSVGPVEGVFSAKLIDFSRPEGEDSDPAPYERDNKFKEGETYQAFTAYFEITAGAFKKCRIPYLHLHYKFEEDRANKGETAWKGDPENKKSTRLLQLIEFCEKLGLTDEPVPWPDDGNILPIFLERIEENPKPVKLVFKNGYIDSLLSVDDEETDESDTESKPRAKTPTTKRVPKREDEDSDDDL